MRSGRLGADALKTDVNTGQARMPGGPGMADQAIQTRSTMPLSTGQTINVTGMPDSPGGHTMSGGDAATVDAQKAQLASAQKDADSRAAIADSATNTQTNLIDAKNMYQALVGATDTRSVLTDGIIAKLAAASGFSIDQLNDAAMARKAIKMILKTSVSSSLTQLQNDPSNPMVRGALQQINDALPDPDTMNDVQFNAGINRMLKTTKRLMDQGAPARKFKNDISLGLSGPTAATSYFGALEALRAQQEADNAKEAAGGGGGEGVGGGGGGETYVFPDVNSANAAVASGQVPHNSKIKVGGKIIGVVGD